MKIKIIVCSGLALALLTGCASMKYEGHEHHHNKCEKCQKCEKCKKCEKCEKCGKVEHHHWHAHQAWLMKEAKVSKKAAEQTALAKVPNGAIKKAELEKEHGKLQWSFDIAAPNSKEITEVNVDAVNGDVISVGKKSAAHEAREGDKDNKH